MDIVGECGRWAALTLRHRKRGFAFSRVRLPLSSTPLGFHLPRRTSCPQHTHSTACFSMSTPSRAQASHVAYTQVMNKLHYYVYCCIEAAVIRNLTPLFANAPCVFLLLLCRASAAARSRCRAA